MLPLFHLAYQNISALRRLKGGSYQGLCDDGLYRFVWSALALLEFFLFIITGSKIFNSFACLTRNDFHHVLSNEKRKDR